LSKTASTRAEHLRHTSTTHPGPAARTKLQFHGRLTELQDLVLLTGDFGEWQEKPNGVWRYRSEDGGGLNWSSTRGTLWFDGRAKPRARLQQINEARLRRKRIS
jgi:hypothetical protein